MASSDSPPHAVLTAHEVFLKYYDKLSKLRLEILASNLVTEKVINSDDHESIRAATSTSGKSAIILRAVSSHLEADYTESFTLLLDLMEMLGDLIMQKVAGEINQELNRSRRSTGEVCEFTGDHNQPRKPEIDFSKYSVDEAFSILTANIYRIFMLHKTEFEVLRRACFENVNTLFGPSIPDELVGKIQNSENLNKLFDILASSPPYWSWINIRILTKMVGVSGVVEATELVERYKEAVFSRKLSMLLKQIPDTHIPPVYYTLVEQKWNRSLDEVTVKDLVTHWANMETLFDVREPTLLLKKVVDGCVEIHWLIPTHLVDHVSSAVFNARHTVTSILYLKINGHVILCNEEAEGTSSASVDKKGDELSQSSIVHYLSSTSSIGSSLVEQVFNNLVDYVITQVTQSTSHCIHQCKSLMASDIHKIGLFSDGQLKELDDYKDNSSLLQNLKPLWSWSDHSVLEMLVRSCDDAVKVLAQFDDRLDRSQLISAYPIPGISPNMAPGDDSPYTVLAVRCAGQLLYQCTLQYIFDMRTLLVCQCEITPHCLQLLAARTDVVYWTIPKCVVSLVVTKVLEYRKAFHDGMISEVSIYPSTRIVTSSDGMLGSLMYLLPTATLPAGENAETASHDAATKTAELIMKWLSQPENLSAVFDNLISQMKNKDDNIFQLRLDYHRISKVYQHVIQQKRQLQVDINVLKKNVAEHKELYEKKVKDFDELLKKNEQQKMKGEQVSVTPSTDKAELEDAMKKLQATVGDFRACIQEISSYNVHTETYGSKDVYRANEQWKSGEEDIGDMTSAKLITISREIMQARNEMEQSFEKQRIIKEKLQEAEAKVEQLEAQVISVNKSKDEALHHVVQQSAQLHDGVKVFKSKVTEQKELYQEEAKGFNEYLLTKKEQLRKEIEQFLLTHSASKMEDTVKKLQAAWDDLRSSFDEMSPHERHTESDDKAEEGLKGSQDVIYNSISATLSDISQQVIEVKDWASKLRRQNLELQRAFDEKSKEAEERNIQVKQLEAGGANVQVEELKKEKKQLLKKVADLRSDVKKPEKVHFGTGQYGETYKMNYEGVWCTGKVLHKSLLTSNAGVANVKKHCSTLHHTNLVAFIGVTEVDKQMVIMTELMKVNLLTYMEQNTELTLDTQVSLCKDMSHGLEELHKHSLLHNNLHSCNILIQDHTAKLSDYYYPLLQVEGHAPDITDIIPFVAPEVIADRSKFSQSSDVYSLAVLCLKVVTGETAVQEHKQNIAAVSQSHILLPLVHKCLTDKTDRRPSAAQICDEIQAAQESPQYISFKALKQTNSMPLFQALKAGNKQLEWRKCATMPAPLVGATAVVLENVIYVSGGESQDEFASRYVFAYHFLENCWVRLPPLTHCYGVPVIISNQLVIIGGKDVKSKKFTNQVSTYNRSEQKWESFYPNLGKERYAPLAITYKHYVIVGGGKYYTIYNRLHDDIEMLDVQDAENLSWKKVPTKLPARMWSPSATISNDQLWIVGFNNDNSASLNLIEQRSDEVFRIPVTDVVTTDKKGKEWESLPRVMPYYSSTVVPNSNPIVTVGGDTRDARAVNALEMHDDSSNAWEQVACLEEPSRAYVAVACLGEQQAIVVLGGCTQTKNKKTRHDSSIALVQIGYAV